MNTSLVNQSTRRSFLRTLASAAPLTVLPVALASPIKVGIEAPAWTLYMSDSFFVKPFKTIRFRGNRLPINVWDHLSEDNGFAMTVVRESDGLRHIYFPPPRRYFKSEEARKSFDSHAYNFQSWSKMRVLRVVEGRFRRIEWQEKYGVGSLAYSASFDKNKDTWAVTYETWNATDSYQSGYLLNEKPFLG